MPAFWRLVVITLFLAFMIIPVLATLGFSIATRWDRSILPEGLTLQWWQAVVERRAFLFTLRNSFIVSLATAACLTILVTPST
jgi:putative spermidine/putrescine transport system permease protein